MLKLMNDSNKGIMLRTSLITNITKGVSRQLVETKILVLLYSSTIPKKLAHYEAFHWESISRNCPFLDYPAWVPEVLFLSKNRRI